MYLDATANLLTSLGLFRRSAGGRALVAQSDGRMPREDGIIVHALFTSEVLPGNHLAPLGADRNW